MEQQVAGNRGENAWSVVRRAAAALGCCAAGFAASAQVLEGNGALEAATGAAEAPMRLEMKASSLPRFDGADAHGSTSRLDLSLLAPTRSAVGLAVGMSGFAAPATTTPALQAGAAPTRPALDLGVHLRHTFESDHQIDLTAWRRVQEQPAPAALALQQQRPSYGARVELNLSPVRRSGFTADRGFVGLQLEGGARITVRRKDGRPMLYYRNSF